MFGIESKTCIVAGGHPMLLTVTQSLSLKLRIWTSSVLCTSNPSVRPNVVGWRPPT